MNDRKNKNEKTSKKNENEKIKKLLKKWKWKSFENKKIERNKKVTRIRCQTNLPAYPKIVKRFAIFWTIDESKRRGKRKRDAGEINEEEASKEIVFGSSSERQREREGQ